LVYFFFFHLHFGLCHSTMQLSRVILALAASGCMVAGTPSAT
jgi:hypothetical protein